MKLKSLYIENYKKFQKKLITFNEFSLDPELERFYGNAHITTLIGSNGSGKTTILSFIAKIFRFLQRNQEYISSEYELIYEINGNLIKIEYLDGSVYFTLNNMKKKLLLEMRRKKGESDYFYKEYQNNINFESITFEDIKKYIPKNLIVSAFDSDYDDLDYGNFICEKIVKKSKSHYFKSVFSLEVSLGIYKFFNEYLKSKNKLKKTLKEMNIIFNGNVKAFFKKDFIHEDEQIYEELEEFSNKYNLYLDKLIEDIIKENIFRNYIIEDSIDGYQWKFNIFNFLKEKKENKELLEILIKNRIFFINDVYLIKEKEYSIEYMSTGEKLILGRIFFMLSHIENQSILIIEEPEIHLNFLWSRQVFFILLTLIKKYKIHVLISSHNWTFINNLNSNQILFLESNSINHPKNSTFLADSNIINNMFGQDKFSDNFIEEYIYQLLEKNDIEKLKFYFEIMGESYLKIVIFEKLIELGALRIHVESN